MVSRITKQIRQSLYRPPYARPEAPIQPPKPLEYQLVDLLSADGIGDEQVEAIRVILMALPAVRRAEDAAREESEVAALTHDLERSMSRENYYLNALMEISNTEGEAANIASQALFSESHLERLRESAESADRGEGVSLAGLSREERRKLLASGIEAASAGETVKHGSTEGESPTVATSDGDAQPQSGALHFTAPPAKCSLRGHEK